MNDKLKHFLAGLIISVITLLAGFGLIGSFCACFAWGLTKEILDKLGSGTCDSYDFIWTLNGWFFMLLVIMTIVLIGG